MKYANLNGKLIEATEGAPKQARCIFCGELVELSTAKRVNEKIYLHKNDRLARICRRDCQAPIETRERVHPFGCARGEAKENEPK